MGGSKDGVREGERVDKTEREVLGIKSGEEGSHQHANGRGPKGSRGRQGADKREREVLGYKSIIDVSIFNYSQLIHVNFSCRITHLLTYKPRIRLTIRRVIIIIILLWTFIHIRRKFTVIVANAPGSV